MAPPRTAAPAPRRHRRIALIGASVLVAFFVLLTVVLIAVDSDALVARVKDRVLDRVSENLGRKVTAEGASARILPNPHVSLRALTIHGKGNEPPFLETAEAEVDLALWPLILSFGREIRVQGITLHEAELNLVREKDGSWSYEDLGNRPDEGGAGAPESEREVIIDRATLVDGVLRIIDRSGSHGEATIALRDIDMVVTGLGVGEAMKLEGAAAFASDAQNLQLTLGLSALPPTFDNLAADQWPELTGSLKVQDARVQRLGGFLPARLSAIVTGGTTDLELGLSTREGAYVLDGKAAVDQLRLRGEPAQASFDVHGTVRPDRPDTAQIALRNISVDGPGVKLGGEADVDLKPMGVQFALEGPLLDLGTLLDVLPESEQESPAARTAMLPARVRQKVEAVDVKGTLRVDQVVNGKLSAQELDAAIELSKGILTVQQGTATFYGGRVDARGTRVDLTQKAPQWKLQARLENVEVEKAMTAISGAAPLHGRLDASLSLTGEGADWEVVQKNVTGGGAMSLQEGALTSTDLGGRLAGALAEGLRKMGRPNAAATVAKAEGRTALKNLVATFSVKDGWMALREPLSFTSSFGGGSLQGRIGLDQTLDLRGEAVLSQQFLTTALRSAGLKAPGAARVPFTLGGTLRQPDVGGLKPADAAKSLLSGGVRDQVEDTVRRQARRRLGDVLNRFGGDGR